VNGIFVWTSDVPTSGFSLLSSCSRSCSVLGSISLVRRSCNRNPNQAVRTEKC